MTQLFHPSSDPVSTWNPEDYGIPREQCEEVWMETDDGQLLYGWYLRANKPVASALYCHGNTGNLTNPAHLMPRLLDSGINLLLFDYRGYGRSSGTATMSGVVADTLAAARYHEDIRPKGLPTILYGFSLGGAIAAQVITRHPFDGVILQSTFTTLRDVAKIAFPRLPMHLVSGTGFDTLRAIRELRVPLLILHGTEDAACPCWMADALYAACGASSKKILRVNGGLHKDLWDRDAPAMIDAIDSFVQELPCTAQPIVEPARFSALRLMRRWLRHVIASAAARHAGRRQVLSC
jgi:alpha-beta hydrolase superfamily lysophospholipase